VSRIHEGFLEDSRAERLREAQPGCRIHPVRLLSLAEYVAACVAITDGQLRLWFRGQSDVSYPLTPSALRFDTERERSKALRSVDDFKRLALTKLPQAPALDAELQWIQLARHYGLPTRLLDWTLNAAIGLYFACEKADKDGLVFVLNPVDMNLAIDSEKPRVLDAERDSVIIRPYLNLTGRITKRGRPTIAVNPILNSERLVLQKGTFTLHGSGNLAITNEEVQSLVALPILSEDKLRLRRELSLVGIDEMSIFPEPEHIGSHIRHLLGL